MLLVLLSFATGITKLIKMPEEMALFAAAGFTDTATFIFGGLQVLSAILLLITTTRRIAAGLLSLSYLVATIVVFINGLIIFGAFSISFIALAAYFFLFPQLKRQALS